MGTINFSKLFLFGRQYVQAILNMTHWVIASCMATGRRSRGERRTRENVTRDTVRKGKLCRAEPRHIRSEQKTMWTSEPDHIERDNAAYKPNSDAAYITEQLLVNEYFTESMF